MVECREWRKSIDGAEVQVTLYCSKDMKSLTRDMVVTKHLSWSLKVDT